MSGITVVLTMEEARYIRGLLGSCARLGFEGVNHNIYAAIYDLVENYDPNVHIPIIAASLLTPIPEVK